MPRKLPSGVVDPVRSVEARRRVDTPLRPLMPYPGWPSCWSRYWTYPQMVGLDAAKLLSELAVALLAWELPYA